MLRNFNWREHAPQYLANATFLLAGYAVGDIVATLSKLLIG